MAYKQSKEFFKQFEPAIKELLFSGFNEAGLNLKEIITTEDHSNPLAKLLDQLSGIDAILVFEDGLAGIALRIQAYTGFETFTIRCEKETGNETELSKRIKGISDGMIYPKYTAQFYIDNIDTNSIFLRIKAGCICHTKDLYNFIQSNPVSIEARKRSSNEINNDHNSFIWVNFTEIALYRENPYWMIKDYKKTFDKDLPNKGQTFFTNNNIKCF